MLRGDADLVLEVLAGAASDERHSRESVDVPDSREENEESEQIDALSPAKRRPDSVIGSMSVVDLHIMQALVVGDAQGLTESSTGPIFVLTRLGSLETYSKL